MLIRNATWNVLGQLLPLIAAIVAVPVIIRYLGVEGFGLVSIIWTLIGYFSLFDFGLGRALTKYISVELECQQADNIPNIVVNGLILLSFIGLCVGAIMWFSSPWLISNLLNIKQSDPVQTKQALQLTSLAIPFVLVNVGLRAIIEGYLHFNLSNLIRIPFGIFTLSSPAIAAYLGYTLPSIVIILFIGINIAMIAYIKVIFTFINKGLILQGRPQLVTAKKLLSFGGWVSLSNFIGPILFYVDRFMISAVLSVAVMAYYVAPYEAITKTLFLSSSIAGSLFPVFAKSSANQSSNHINIMLAGSKIICMVMFVIVLITLFFGYDLLNLWVGKEIAMNGTSALQILSIGVFFNAIAYLPFTFIQASGRADLIAKLHLVQLPLYIIAMWFSISHFGLDGAAYVWGTRALIEMIIFFSWAEKNEAIKKASKLVTTYFLTGMIGLIMTKFMINIPMSTRAVTFVLALITSQTFFWFFLLSENDRIWLCDKTKSRSKR
jgi:O-antigen/teichoic acid export membrane protein